MNTKESDHVYVPSNCMWCFDKVSHRMYIFRPPVCLLFLKIYLFVSCWRRAWSFIPWYLYLYSSNNALSHEQNMPYVDGNLKQHHPAPLYRQRKEKSEMTPQSFLTLLCSETTAHSMHHISLCNFYIIGYVQNNPDTIFQSNWIVACPINWIKKCLNHLLQSQWILFLSDSFRLTWLTVQLQADLWERSITL